MARRINGTKLVEQDEDFVAAPPPQVQYVQFAMVELAHLKTPIDIYQRPQSRKAVQSIVEAGWDNFLGNVIIVSAKTNNVLDGGHRVEAARQLGMTQIAALVYHGISPQDEARYFVGLNKLRRRVGLKATHRAELYTGGAEAVDAQKVVEALAPSKAPLQTIHAANAKHPGVLLSIAPVLKQMDTHTFSRDFIAGVIHFAAHHPMTEETRARFLEPGMYRAITYAIKQEMREAMQRTNRIALPTDWSVKGEGVLLALNTRPVRIPREVVI